MIKIRKYNESDARDLWGIFYHTIRNVNSRDYTQAQVEAWAPDNASPEVWQQKMNAISPFVAEIDGEIVGYLSSGGYGHALGGAMGLGYVPCKGEDAASVLASSYEIDVAGTRVKAEASLRPMYDPKSERVKV